MTTEPVLITPTSSPTQKLDTPLDKQITIIDDLFTLGYTKSEEYKIYEDDNGVEVRVQYRTLTPSELRDIAETLQGYKSIIAQVWTEKIETLARSIVFVNKMPLILDTRDRKEYEEKYSTQLSTLVQARIILYEKIKSPYLIDLMFEKYQEFTEKVAKQFDDVKKKLKNPSPSVSTGA